MPNGKEREFSILNEQHVVGLLAYLSEREYAYANELRVVSGNYIKLKALAEELRDLGLLEISIEEKPRLTYIYRLTEKGKLVAKKLKEIEEIIGGD